MHAVGQSDLQRLRMAETVLSVAGRLCEDVQRIDGNDGVGQVRPQERQRKVRRLHGALRIRSHGGGPHIWVVERVCPDGEVDAFAGVSERERIMPAEVANTNVPSGSLEGATLFLCNDQERIEALDKAFDY